MKIRELDKNDIADVALIEQQVWGEEGATIEQIKARQKTFPKGNIVAVLPNGKIVGYAVSQKVDHISTGSWAEQTDNGLTVKTHKPNGTIAYGVNMSALPEAARLGVSKAIIDHYYKIYIKEGGCSILCLGSRLPGFAKWQKRNEGTVKDYLGETLRGLSIDPELRLYQKRQFSLLWEMPDYFPDPESMNYGVMIARTPAYL